MSSEHQIFIHEATGQVELDYSDIFLNIEDTIAQQVSDQIQNEAWHSIEYHTYDAINDTITERQLDVPDEIETLLWDFHRSVRPCNVGESFIQAVRKALTWDGEQFHKVPDKVEPVAIDYHWLQKSIAKEIKVQMKGLTYRMSKVLTDMAKNMEDAFVPFIDPHEQPTLSGSDDGAEIAATP
tara:strand:- start:769 stop:1314 length:546 start_codon:yes stop_codon:yes gene_type:complete